MGAVIKSGISIAAWLWALVLLPVVPILGFAGYSIYQYTQEREHALEENLINQAESLSAQVNSQLERVAGLLHAIAESDTAQSGNMAQLYAYAKRLQETSNFLVAISLADPSGQLLFMSLRPLGTALPAVDPNSVRETFATGKPILSNPVKSPISDRLGVVVNVPVFRDGQVVYSLRGVIDLLSLSKQIAISGPLPGVATAIANADGILVARSPSPEQYIGKLATPGFRYAIQNKLRTVWQGESRLGTPVLMASRPIGDWGLTVAVSVPAAELMAPLHRELAGFVAFSIAILLLLTLAITLVNRHIAGQLSAVARNAQMSLDSALASPGTTFIRELDDLQNSVVQSHGYRKALRDQVQAGTAELTVAQQRLLEFTQKLDDEVERERLRIAREVHDQIGAVLSGVSMLLDADKKPFLSEDKRQLLHSALDQGMATVRRITAELRPPLLDDLGLQAAVEAMAQTMLTPLHIACVVSLEHCELLSQRQAIGCFRILQEAVTNVARHSSGRTCQITGNRQENKRYLIEVADDGVGLPSPPPTDRHFGHVGMLERANLMGGVLEVGNRPCGGCVVRLTIPLPEENRLDA